MSSKRLLHLVNEFEPPSKKLVSDADIFIKDLVKKQQNTIVTLNQELANPKEFCKGTELVTLANYCAGTNTLNEFQTIVTHFEGIAKLKAAGLAENDIKLYLDFQNGGDYLIANHKNCQKSFLSESLKRIKDVLEDYETKLNSDVKHKETFTDELDSLSVKPDSNATKLYKFALENDNLKKKPGIPHPMDNLKDIEENFRKSFTESKLPNINKIRRRARTLHKKINCNTETSSCSNDYTSGSNANHYGINSRWDQKTQSMMQKPKQKKQLYTCSPQNYYTIKDGEIIRLGKSECDKVEPLIPQKLTTEEITKIPKFKGYAKGITSKVLYLKNLGNHVKESDLKELFKGHDKNGDLIYKIMKGKMKGQAFITFTDEDSASKALEECNGVFIKNKPVIIQFGCGQG